MRNFVKRLGWVLFLGLGILTWGGPLAPAATNAQTIEKNTEIEITLDCTRLNLHVGNTCQLVASANCLASSLTWTSSKPSVVSVDQGFLTAKKAGSATISVSAGEALATCQVSVKRTNAREGIYAYTYPQSTKEKDLFYVLAMEKGTLTFVLEHLDEKGARAVSLGPITVSLAGNKTGFFTWRDNLTNAGVGSAVFTGTRVCLHLQTIIQGEGDWSWEKTPLVMTLTEQKLSRQEIEALLG